MTNIKIKTNKNEDLLYNIHNCVVELRQSSMSRPALKRNMADFRNPCGPLLPSRVKRLCPSHYLLIQCYLKFVYMEVYILF